MAQLDHDEWEGQLRELSAAVSCLPELFEEEERQASRGSRHGGEEEQRQLVVLQQRLTAMAAWHDAKARMLQRAVRRLAAARTDDGLGDPAELSAGANAV